MKVNKNEFTKAVKNTAKIALSFMTSTANAINLVKKGKWLEISAINPSSSLICKVEIIEGETEKDFVVGLSADLLLQGTVKCSNASKSDDISLELSESGTEVLLKSGRAKCALAKISDTTDSLKKSDKLIRELKEIDLYNKVIATKHAVATKFADPKMGSFYVQVGDNNEVSVTTLDGVRISIRGEVKNPQSWIVAGKPFIDAISIASEGGNKTVSIISVDNPNYIIIRGDAVVCTVATFTGAFFNMDNIISMCMNEKAVEIDKNDFTKALDLCSFIEKTVKIQFRENECIINSSKDGGKTEMKVEGKFEKTFTCALNANFAKDALSSIEGDKVFLRMHSATSPMLISSIDDEAKEVILPIKLP